MITLDHPRKWRAFLNGIWERAEHHGPEALSIVGALTLAVLRHVRLGDWPRATSGKRIEDAPGAQARFRHGRHYLKLRWDHDTRTIHLTEIDGQRDGRTLERFRETDSAAQVDSKLAAALAELDRGAAQARRSAKVTVVAAHRNGVTQPQ